MVAVVVNFSAAIGRLSFESIVQRDGPETNRGQAFARFETRFQLGWVIAAVLPVLLEISGSVGFLLGGRRGGRSRDELRRRSARGRSRQSWRCSPLTDPGGPQSVRQRIARAIRR